MWGGNLSPVHRLTCADAPDVFAYRGSKLTLGIAFGQSSPDSLVEPRIHKIQGYLVSYLAPRSLCLHFPALELQVVITLTWMYVFSRDWRSGHHVCRPSTLSTKPFPQPHNYPPRIADPCVRTVFFVREAVFPIHNALRILGTQ